MIKVSDYIIKFLEELGIKHVFLLPGGGSIHLIDSIGKSNIQYVCNLHEQAAGVCAEAYGQYTNNLGVAITTTGPGGTNIITPLAGAWLDSTPMLVLCGQVKTNDRVGDSGLRQRGFQELNIVKLVESITKYAFTVIDAKTIKYHLQKAVFLAQSGRSGPVLLEIPLDIQAQLVEENLLESFFPEVSHLSISPVCIDNIINTINQAQKPIILAGNGVRLSNGSDEFYKFINRTQIPVLLTWKAADFLEETHSLYVGRPGIICQEGANLNQQTADLIICLGARLDHGQIAYKFENFASQAKKIIVDIDLNELNKFDGVEYKINYNVKSFLSILNERINRIKPSNWVREAKETYLKYKVGYTGVLKDRINVYDFVENLSNLLPEDSLIIPGSSGICSEVIMQSIKLKKCSRIFNTPGLGSMGFGVCAAIGACLASGCKETVCIEGDGSFAMNIQELELISRLQLPVKIFILSNDGYASIRNTQNNMFNRNLVASNFKSGLTLPCIEDIARGFDLEYFSITNYDFSVDLKDLLKKKNCSFICEVFIDLNHKTTPKVAMAKDKNGNFSALPMENINS